MGVLKEENNENLIINSQIELFNILFSILNACKVS